MGENMNFFEDAKQRDGLYATAWGALREGHAEGQTPDAAATAAAAFIPLVAARIAALHEALAGLGLSAAQPREDSIRLVGMTEKVVQLAFQDKATDRDINLDLAWNGNAFLAGRRYESSMSRVSLSDAEITRTSILRVDIERTNAAIVVTFLTLDGKDARIHIAAKTPLDPTLEGKVPLAAIETLKARPPSASLADLCRRAMGCAERAGAGKGLFSRLLDAPARRAHADQQTLSAYLAKPSDAGLEAQAWAKTPQVMRNVAETVVRRLSEDAETEAPILVRALIVITVGQILARVDAPPPTP